MKKTWSSGARINDRGEFESSFSAPGAVALEGIGYYFNEVTGELSASTLNLCAEGCDPLAAPPCPGDEVCCALSGLHREAFGTALEAPRWSCVDAAFCGDGALEESCNAIDTTTDACGPGLLCGASPPFSRQACLEPCDLLAPEACGAAERTGAVEALTPIQTPGDLGAALAVGGIDVNAP